MALLLVLYGGEGGSLVLCFGGRAPSPTWGVRWLASAHVKEKHEDAKKFTLFWLPRIPAPDDKPPHVENQHDFHIFSTCRLSVVHSSSENRGRICRRWRLLIGVSGTPRTPYSRSFLFYLRTGAPSRAPFACVGGLGPDVSRGGPTSRSGAPPT